MLGSSFGQSEPLTTRLHNLVRSYPKGVGLFKEFIQNADDAEANEILFLIDEREFDVNGLPDNMKWLHKVPSLLIYNNKLFTEKDIKGIQSIGASGKSNSIGKTGRFGLGFNSSYNVTDVPYFLTNGGVYFFDPHLETINNTDLNSPGRSYKVEEILNENWPIMESFSPIIDDYSNFKGTVFRLPFRNDEWALRSKIKNERYTIEDAFKCVDELKKIGSGILIFLKYVNKLKIQHRNKIGEITDLLCLEASNENEIVRSKKEVNELLHYDSIKLLNYIDCYGEIYSNCIHKYTVKYDNKIFEDEWRVIDGFFYDEDKVVIESCKQMLNNQQKALPYAGAAYKLNCKQNIKGTVCCFLPVPIQNSLPVFINGYFDLDDSRQNMFLDENSCGIDSIRYNWNKSLLEYSITFAYIKLLENLKNDLNKSFDQFYSCFPKLEENNSTWESWLAKSLYRNSLNVPLIRASGLIEWLTIEKVKFIPNALNLLKSALYEESSLPIPYDIPSHIRAGYKYVGGKTKFIDLKDMIDLLKIDYDINCLINNSLRPCLRDKKYIECILEFFQEKENTISITEAYGLPLVIDYNDHLRTIGKTENNLYYTDNKLDLSIFIEKPEWFIKIGPQIIWKNNEQVALRLMNLTDDRFMDLLYEYVSSYGETINLNREGIYSDGWLQDVYKKLINFDSDFINNNSKITEMPLVPNQHSILMKVGTKSTPLLQTKKNESLRRALLELSIPLVGEVSTELIKVITEFSDKYSLVYKVTLVDLLDTIEECCLDQIETYDVFTNVQQTLLDFFTEKDNLEEIKQKIKYVNRLKKLKIYPTVEDKLVNLDNETYIPQDYSFPKVNIDVTLLDCMNNNHLMTLYDVLGVEKLSRFTFVKEWIVPKAEYLSDNDKHIVLLWLRNNLSYLCEDSDNINNLIDELSNIPLIYGEDGIFYTAQGVYQPSSKLAKDILPDLVVFPDMSETYSKDKIAWENFFDYIKMPLEPRLNDILNYVKIILIDSKSVADKTTKLELIYDYIRKYIEHEYENMKNLEDDTLKFLADLNEIPWIPVIKESNDILCLKESGCEFAYSNEIYFSNDAMLVGSQRLISTFKHAPSKQLRELMGFPLKILVDDVVKHFKMIICNYIDINKDDKRLLPTIKRIYKFFGGDTSLNEENEDLNSTINLQNEFIKLNCIWDTDTMHFWKPKYVFKENVNYMAPWCKTIKYSDIKIDRGLDALGRNDRPSIEDHKCILKDISQSGEIFKEETNTGRTTIKIIRNIVETLIENNASDPDVLVPTRDGDFQLSRNVYIADAPWYDSMLDDFHIPVLSKSVADITEIHHKLCIHSLAESITERLNENYEDSIDKSKEICYSLQNIIHTNEFIQGLQRLIYNEESGVDNFTLSIIKSLVILEVNDISIDLYINDNTEFLGKSKAHYYLNTLNNQAILVSKRKRYYINDMAEIINRILGNKLQNLAPLNQILSCKPKEISMVLDDLKIRSYNYKDLEFMEDNNKINVQNFDNEDSYSDTYEENYVTTYSESENSDIVYINDDINAYCHGNSTSIDANNKTVNKKISNVNFNYTKEINFNRNTSSYKKNRTGTLFNDFFANNKSNKNISNHYAVSRRRLNAFVISRNTEISLCDTLNNNEDDINDKAIQIVKDFEKSIGREVCTPNEDIHNNIIHSITNTEDRVIIVKGINSTWEKQNIELSINEYEKLHHNWLYVVESVNSTKPRIYIIYQPTLNIFSYNFDNKWKQISEIIDLNDENSKEPKIGNLIIDNGINLGCINKIEERGKLKLLYYETTNGVTKMKVYSEKLEFKEKE